MKKQLLLILMLLLPLGASADKSGTCGTNLKWNYVEETHILKIFGNGAMTDFNLYTNPWREINVERVIIEEGVTSIGTCAFVYQSSLTSVIIPNSVTKIGYAAFASCGNLSSITIPTSVTSIGGEAFYGCVRLTSITIPNSVTSIEKRAFCGCTGLTSITIPNSVTTIGESAFYGCWKLTSITIPNGVTRIESNTFGDCNNLSTVTIPNSVTSIASEAFADCKNLSSITIPNSVRYIEGSAFAWCSSLTSITIPNRVTSIESKTFFGCTSLTSVTIPNSVTNIKYNAFDGCSSLTSVTIPNSVTCIGDEAFQNCSGLTSITIPNSVTDIGIWAFKNCSSLTSVTIGNKVTVLGDYAFSYCNNLTTIVVEKGNSKYDSRDNCNAIIETSSNQLIVGCKNTTISNSVTSIGAGAFYGCKGLTSITIPNSVTIIGHVAFADCSSLASITIPNSVIEIVNQAFEYCSGLKTITIPNSIESIGYRAFAGCSGLTNVYCLAKNVPETDTYTFIGAYIENTILHVPAASVDAYSSIDPWRNFKDIVGIVLPEHTLTYLLDGKEYKSYKIEEGEIITPEPQPTKEGYTFSGWSEIPATMPAQDVIITGSFKINKYLLTYKVDDEIVKSDSIVYNTVITPEANPTKEGYTFSGWSAIPETMPAQDVVITGSFKINKYLLTYKVDDEIVKSDSIVYNTAITPEAEPTKEGYTFSGWSEIPETMPAKDVLVTGTFSINSYKLTYMIDDKVYKDTVYEYSATIIPEPIPAGNYATFEWIDLPEAMPAHDVVVHASYTTGIREMILTKPQDVQIYSLNGKKLNKLQKGLNIVRMSNGTTKKVVVK